MEGDMDKGKTSRPRPRRIRKAQDPVLERPQAPAFAPETQPDPEALPPEIEDRGGWPAQKGQEE